MGRFVIQPDPNKDEYVLWSTIAENAITPVLTRKELHAFMLKEANDRANKDIHKFLEERAVATGHKETIMVTNIDHDDEDLEGFYHLHIRDVAQFVKAQGKGDAVTMKRLLERIDD